MKFYHRLEWQLAFAIIIALGLTITFTGLLNQTTVGIFLTPLEANSGVNKPDYKQYLGSLSEPQNTKQQIAGLITDFEQQSGGDDNVIIVTNQRFEIQGFSNSEFVFTELVRAEPDGQGYSVVLSSLYNKQEIIQIYNRVPAFHWGTEYLIFIVPDPTFKSEPSTFNIITKNLGKHVRELGIYYALVGMFIILLVRFRLAPLRMLESFSQKLSSEKLPAPMPASGFKDEVNSLVSAFNKARDRLEQEKDRRNELLAEISHELRTPLHNMRGRLELASEGIIEGDDKTVKYALDQTQQLVNLVNDLDLLSALDSADLHLEKQAIDLQGFLQEKLQAGRVSSPYEWSLSCPEVICEIDPIRMTEVFDNLVQNSVYAKAEGLRLDIECSVSEKRVLIVFTDNGPGVPEAALPMLFDRLYRVDASRTQATGGSGLGLSIVDKIIRAHGGEIDAFLPEGGGLGFRMELPRFDA